MSLSELNEEQCELHSSLQLLRDVPVFNGLAPEFFRVMAYLCERHLFAAEQVILTRGETAEAAVVLVRGSARIELGERQVATLDKGSFVGGLALLGQFRWLYSLRAATEVECLVLPRRTFLPQFMARPDALAVLAGKLVGSVVGWEQRQLERPGEERSYGLGML